MRTWAPFLKRHGSRFNLFAEFQWRINARERLLGRPRTRDIDRPVTEQPPSQALLHPDMLYCCEQGFQRMVTDSPRFDQNARIRHPKLREVPRK